ADGFTPSPETIALAEHPSVRLYVNERNVGPYVSAMGTWSHHVSDWYAVSDADDLDSPGRFWDAVTVLREYEADLFGAAMDQFVDPGHERSEAEVGRVPYHRSGSVWGCAPYGTCVHTTCVFRRSSFEALNGYRSLFCAGDVEINTRGRFAGWRIVISPALHGHRRLRDDSLSRGGEWQVGKPKRLELEATLAADYALWSERGCDAAAYGGLPDVLADPGVC
ncbi:glycosyltransferase, partial [Alienimonas sp. DA493]|uniref:glycosyltransferase n=1 Tax=Alienimonas sp. DA493 TaxID=3373605 RepID=UPI003754E5F7